MDALPLLSSNHETVSMYPTKMHLAAFYSSLAASQTALAASPVVDGALTTNNNGFLLPENARVAYSYASGLGVTRAAFAVPSLRVVAQPNIHPVNQALYPVDDAPINRPGDQGPRILQSETFAANLTSDATAGPNDSYVLAWLRMGQMVRPAGDITTIRATATVTAVTGAWVVGAMTMEADLPTGYYAVVGMDATAATTVAIRLRFPGQVYAPGVLAQQAAGQFFLNDFRYANSGVFGAFRNSAIPLIEVLGTAGAQTITMYLDLIQVSQ